MRKLVIVAVIVIVVACLALWALAEGGRVVDEQNTQTAQMATEWQRDVVAPIQTERAAATATARAR